MLIRIPLLRFPCTRSNPAYGNITRTFPTRQYTARRPIPRPQPPQPANRPPPTTENPDSEIPATWPSKPPPSSTNPEEPRHSPPNLLDLLPLYTTQVPGSESKHVSAFLPQTEKAFYPQPRQVLLDARSSSKFVPRNLDLSTEERSLKIHIHNTSLETHITVTNAQRETLMGVSIERARLEGPRGQIGVRGVGSVTSMEEAVRKFVERYPFVLDQARVELTLKGFGPGKLDGLTKVLGPLGDEIQNRMMSTTKNG